MKLFFAVAAVFLSLSPRAQAQQFTCAGPDAPTAKLMTLAVKLGGNLVVPIGLNEAESVLDLAECQCDSKDLLVEMSLMAGLPIGTRHGFSVWAGTNCDSIKRGTSCETVASTLRSDNFWQGASNSSLCSGVPCQPVPVTSVIQPAYMGNAMAHQCSGGATNSGIWFLFGDLSGPSYCTLRLDAVLTPPGAPVGLVATPGGTSIAIQWNPPLQGTPRPTHYQVLCADGGGNPVPGRGGYAFGEDATGRWPLGYSICGKDGLERRANISSDGVSPTTSGLVPFAPTTGSFASLDKRFVCSDILDANTSAAKIDNLAGGQTYQLMVVGVDDHGNPIASGIQSAETSRSPDMAAKAVDMSAANPMVAMPGGCAVGSQGSGKRAPSTWFLVALGLGLGLGRGRGRGRGRGLINLARRRRRPVVLLAAQGRQGQIRK